MPAPLFDLLCAGCGRPYPAAPGAVTDTPLPHACPDCGGFWAYGDALAWRPPRPLPGLRAWAHLLGIEPEELAPRALARPARRHALDGATVWISQQGVSRQGVSPQDPGPIPDRASGGAQDPAPGGEGSFKERGAEVLAAACARLGLHQVFLDSSGNAGIAVAGAMTARGIACRVLVPASTPRSKLARLEALGARVDVIPGDRQAAAAAARELRNRLPYASHVVQPFFHAGVATLAWDLVEELGPAIDRIVLPVGQGSLLLGLVLGFERLLRAGAIGRLPRLHAVQLAGYATLAAVDPGRNPDSRGAGRPAGPPVAAGIAVLDPPRRAELSAWIERSGGDVTVVTEGEIAAARDEMADAGYPTDPTGAAAWAGLRKRPETAGEGTVVLLTSFSARRPAARP
ncbi:MAG: pyridoxal-phosphate dependent enzyme [Acidobacteriota bacterium]|jgi:threonine synthase